MAKPDAFKSLLDDPSAPLPLAEAVRAARAREPAAEHLERMAAGLGLALPPLPPPATPAPLSGAAGASKLGAALKGLAALGAVSVAATMGLRAVAPAPVKPAVTVSTAPPPRPADEAKPPPSEPSPPAAVVEPAAPPAAQRPALRHSVAARSSAPPPLASVPAATPSATPSAAPSDVASRLREEAALVRKAEAVLASDPALSLRLLGERRERFPSGVLGQEASVVAIDALLRLGRRAEAETRARAFEAAHPGSLHARRIRRLLEAQ